jgi:Cu(I)-responsive transcriptional regulator
MQADCCTIGSLAKITGTNVETIRYYERIGILPVPSRTGGNYRSYGPQHVARLSFVRRSRNLGFSLETIRNLLRLADDRDRHCAAVDAIAQQHLAEVERKIADLTALGGELRALIGDCRHGTISECRIIEALSPHAAGA